MNQDIADAVRISSISFDAYLTESIGFVYGDKNTGTGVIFREIIPRPVVNEPRQMIPYFSLYSRDDFFTQDMPILIELIELNSHYDPWVFFFVNIIIGLIQDTWVYFVSNRGILPEMHGQIFFWKLMFVVYLRGSFTEISRVCTRTRIFEQ